MNLVRLEFVFCTSMSRQYASFRFAERCRLLMWATGSICILPVLRQITLVWCCPSQALTHKLYGVQVRKSVHSWPASHW